MAEYTVASDEEVAQCWQELRIKCIKQCDLLIDAGWKFEAPTPDCEAWSFYWRRPPRRKGSKGMLFRSTQQAYNYLMRSQGKEPEIFV